MTQAFWWELYTAAMVEVDTVELRRKIDRANAAIHERLNDLANRRDGEAVDERRQIVEALQGLQTLQRLECQLPPDAIASKPGLQEGAQ
jgi:hypothetical protein